MKIYFENKLYQVPFIAVSKIEEFSAYVKVQFYNEKSYFRIEQLKDYKEWKKLNKEGKNNDN